MPEISLSIIRIRQVPADINSPDITCHKQDKTNTENKSGKQYMTFPVAVKKKRKTAAADDTNLCAGLPYNFLQSAEPTDR